MDVAIYLVDNWDIVTLLVTNVVALFMNRPKLGRKKEDVL